LVKKFQLGKEEESSLNDFEFFKRLGPYRF